MAKKRIKSHAVRVPPVATPSPAPIAEAQPAPARPAPALAAPPATTLLVGDPAPWFTQRAPDNPNFVFDTAAGRYVVLCFYGSAASDAGRRALNAIMAQRALFNDSHACVFGISTDPADEAQGRVQNQLPGVRFFWDFDHKIGDLYGAPRDGGLWVVLDPTLRVLAIAPFA